MKRNLRYDRKDMLFGVITTIIFVVMLSSCKPKHNQGATPTDEMSNMPGMEQPKHDMRKMAPMKVKQDSNVEAGKLDIKVDDLVKPVNQNVISQLATIRPSMSKRDLIVQAKGVIEYDQRRLTNVSSRVTGRIEKTNIKFEFQAVRKGQLLFTIYSPELLNAQEDFLLLLTQDGNNQFLIVSTREKLMLLGFSKEQVHEIENNRKPLLSVAIYSPSDGYVIANGSRQTSSAMKSSTSTMGAGMMASSANENQTTVPNSNELITREGQYVNKGETVFRIVNTNVVWGMLKIYPEDAEKINTGDKVHVLSAENEAIPNAQIDFIEKYFSTADNAVTARIYLNNIGAHYKIGDLLSATIASGHKEAIWIPREAVLDIGNSSIVFVKKGAVFKAVEVKTGMRNGKEVELVSGISPGDEIAANAQYLVDSEAFIKAE